VPLRERREDIGPLAAHFLQGTSAKLKTSELRLTEGDVRRLARYDWPGNVRELQNAIERGAILAHKGRLRIDLPEPMTAPRPNGNGTVAEARPTVLTDDERRARDRDNILSALAACGGKVFGRSGAAELLGVKPTTLASRIKSLGIQASRTAAE
jgi:DNA-binding NtrC family response regulator